MKKYVEASKSDKLQASSQCERLANELSDFLANYSTMLSMAGVGVLNDDELEELGEAMDILYDAAQILSF